MSGLDGDDTSVEFDSLQQLSRDSDKLAEMNADLVKASPCTFTPQQVSGIVHKNRFWREPAVDIVRAAIGVQDQVRLPSSVFLQLSFINHSCVVNCHHQFIGDY